MPEKPKIVCAGALTDLQARVLAALNDAFEVVTVRTADEALDRLKQESSSGAYVGSGVLEVGPVVAQLPWSERILDELPDGVALIDDESVIAWANERFRHLARSAAVAGANFYAVLGNPDLLGPDFCPFHTALTTGEPSGTKLRAGDKTYYQLYVCPVRGLEGSPARLVVVVRDITAEVHQRQKLEAIHQAGITLTDLQPDEVSQMTVDDRIELLKSNILHYTQDLLDFRVVEIRLLEESTGRLLPLLAEGIEPVAAERQLYAKPQDNGVTGYVAATGKSYLCEDAQRDPLYLPAFPGARSSLTVPLVLHDHVIGTFNVESAEPHAFTPNDLVFLELFARDVAVALNTLELLEAQQVVATQESVEAIHRAVALPIDRILNEAVEVLESYIGHEPQLEERLRNILRNARDIRELIRDIGQNLAPEDAVPVGAAGAAPDRKQFRNVRVLVADADEAVLHDAHTILEKHGCTVETARSGAQAVSMVRSSLNEAPYQVIITDVRLPDMTGHGLMVQLKAHMAKVPLVLMQGFGYDPGHSIVKARQEGLHPKAVLYKPFRVNQLLDVIETMLEAEGQKRRARADQG